ncbi:MAG: tetratricopeptide repeat protein [Planctomycetota bacterium]
MFSIEPAFHPYLIVSFAKSVPVVNEVSAAAAEPSPPSGRPGRRTLSPWRRRLFRLGAVLVGLLAVLLLEIALRCVGIGRDLNLIIPIKNATGWYQLNPQFDEAFYGQGDLSGPEVRPFQIPKPLRTRRILVVGGSTVVGFPYASELAFPRHLQFSLQSQADDGDTIEVLNAGITALNSSAEVAVVAEGLKADPDVVVVYTGHNEFYGPGGVASSSGWLSPGRYRTAAWWRRLYLVQAFRWLKSSRQPSQDLIASLPADLHIALEGETFQRGIARFEENLTEMASLARNARVPILFVSPVANEHHQPPIENLRAGPNHVEELAWREKLKAGERQLLWGDKTKALQLFETARAECERDPLIRYRLAQACEKAGRLEEAVTEYQQALDLDGCRFRAPSPFRSTMAAVASRYSANEVFYVDLHAALCDGETIAIPGRRHFFEHVHLTWEGNRVVGDVIARSIWQQVWSRTWSVDRSNDDGLVGSRLAVQPEDHLAAHALAMMIYQRPPFREGADAEKLARELAEDSAFAFGRLVPERQKIFEQLTQAEMSTDLIAALIARCRRTQQDDLLGTFLQARVVRQPWNLAARNELVNWLRSHAHVEEADRVQSSLSEWPGSDQSP